MTSSKPYLIRGLYEWLVDNDVTPYILVDVSFEGVMIPGGIASDGKVVLNLAPGAIQKLEMTNEYLSFSARFGGVAQNVYCPVQSILAIYAKENGEGMMFSEDSNQTADSNNSGNKKTGSKKTARPGLKIVK